MDKGLIAAAPQISKRKRRIAARAGTPTVMTPDQLARLPIIRATEEMPIWPKTDARMLVEVGEGSPSASVRFEPVAGEHGAHLYAANIIPQKGRIVDRRRGQAQGFLTAEEIRNIATRLPDAHRPPWLDLVHAPATVPRRSRISAARFGLPPAFGPLHLDYQEIPLVGWPWCTIGRVFVGAGDDFSNWTESGTGTLVGPNLMLTASHIAPWDVDGWWMRFVPAYQDGSGPFGDSFVRQFRGVKSPDDQHDYIICDLYTPLGNRAGWMGSYSSSDDDFYEDGIWHSVGYPGSYMNAERAVLQAAISPEDADINGDGAVLDFEPPFADHGWSGGPLFGWVDDQPRVVGIERGEEEEKFLFVTLDDDTVFSGGEHMVNLVKYGYANWPAT
jgi:hypothetical protein